jgi:hypothetical protein
VKSLFTTILLLAGIVKAVNLSAQSSSSIFQQIESRKPGSGTVRIIQDNKIRDLVNLHLTQQKKVNGIKGYRIWIYSGSGQEANKGADQARARFISKYGVEIKSYKRFEYPFFKVYVGDFRTKSEALRFYKKIENDYPDAFIREDIIAFPD